MAMMTDRILVKVDAQTAGAVGEFGKLERSARGTQGAFDRMGSAIGVTGKTLRTGLVAGAAALVGTNLVQFLSKSVTQVTALAAQVRTLQARMGTTAEDASRLVGAMRLLGVNVEDGTVAMQRFATNLGKGGKALQALGVDIQRTAAGNVDVLETFLAVADAYAGTADATQKAALAQAAFGRQWTTLAPLLAKGADGVREAMEKVSGVQVFTDAELKTVKEYDLAMKSAKLAVQDVGLTLGRALLPVVSAGTSLIEGMSRVLQPLVGLLGQIPADVYLVAGAALLLSRVITVDLIQTAVARAIFGFATLAVAATNTSIALSLVRGAFTALGAAIAANPVGAALLVITAGYALMSSAMKAAEGQAKEFTGRLYELEKSGMSAADALQRTAEEADRTASIWQRFGAEVKGSSLLDVLTQGPLVQFVQAITASGDSVEGFRKEIAKVREEEGAFAAVTATATAAQKELLDRIVDGERGTKEYRDALLLAEEATRDKSAAEKQLQADLDAVVVSMEDLIDTEKRLAGLRVGTLSSYQGLEEQLAGYAEATKDVLPVLDETAFANEKIVQSAWDYAEAALAQGKSTQDVVAGLQDLQAAYPNLAAVIQPVIDELSKDREVSPKVTVAPNLVLAKETAALAGQINTLLAPLGGSVVAPDVQQNVVPRVDKGQLAAEVAAVDSAFRDITAMIKVETRGGPAAKAYMDGLAAQSRLALIRVESRNGPAVDRYLDSIAEDRSTTVWVTLRNSATGQRLAQIPQGRSALGAAARMSDAGSWGAPITVNVATNDPRRVVDAIERYARISGRGVTVTA